MFPTELLNGLWHTTSLKRLKGILEHGSISPNPNIPDSERWCTGNGKKNYPYVRHINGVSLFDFIGFNPDEYRKKYPISSWSTFVPKSKRFDDTVWIEINREKIKKNFIGGTELLHKWKNEEYLGHNIMPIIECAYLGELEINNFLKILLYENSTNKFSTLQQA